MNNCKPTLTALMTSASSECNTGAKTRPLIDSICPNPPSENCKVRQESAESSTFDLDMNYVKPYHHTLACAVSFCQPTMSSSSRAAIRHLVASGLPHLPSERAKGQEGSAEAQPADHDMNYGKLYHHTLARVSCHLLLSIQHVQHQPGSTPGLLSIAVEPKSSPGKRAERQEGSACS